MGNNISKTSTLYREANVVHSVLGEYTSVGDFSKVEESKLDDYARIDRYNYIWKSHIGRHSYTGKNTSIIDSSIGNFASISWNVTIGGANHNYNKITTHSFLYNDIDNIRPDNSGIAYDRFTEKCDIENDVWIGTGAIILRDVHIGNGAVIAAGSIVTKDVSDYAVVAGNPAKVIKYRFDENMIERLLKLKWWDWPDEKIKDNYHFFVDCNFERIR